jgi:hypothetical protein
VSIWIGYWINWIISEVQASKKFFFIFLASKKLLAPLRSRIGTGSVFCHSFLASPWVLSLLRTSYQSLALQLDETSLGYYLKSANILIDEKDLKEARVY